MLVVSSREFRDKQAMYLDQADEGKEILVMRGKNKSYRIIPVTEDDTVVKKEYLLAPDESLARAITAEELISAVKEDLKVIFDNKSSEE